ncbi:hypothetical protein IQ255_05950 [Pleurocapsales cyanobacterium LEGE 10410]|nr:hypothetical protein [Pleurocapsales cyanobacterium LEGE 10410]
MYYSILPSQTKHFRHLKHLSVVTKHLWSGIEHFEADTWLNFAGANLGYQAGSDCFN